MKDCSKTITGKHQFELPATHENPTKDILGRYLDFPICIFCGMIDNRRETDGSKV
jgi:hypothetical protein